MLGCGRSLSNKINAIGSTNPLIWTALAECSPGRQSWVGWDAEQSRKGRLKVRSFSAVPSGLNHVSKSTQDFVLGYTEPSLRD